MNIINPSSGSDELVSTSAGSDYMVAEGVKTCSADEERWVIDMNKSLLLISA